MVVPIYFGWIPPKKHISRIFLKIRIFDGDSTAFVFFYWKWLKKPLFAYIWTQKIAKTSNMKKKRVYIIVVRTKMYIFANL